ncbi:MAG: type II toxin-antitoxin system PemK/MazF family toxin [Candidatus Omnitrophica bacterium]|nr:type II toxin-antitoxin system PemK/MazF family toxin [Candidatus Omnitrophota bacterium]
MKNPHPQRGEIWVVQLDPAIGSEIKKTRPALIISNNAHNRFMGHLTVLPISDAGEKVYLVEVFLPAGIANLTKNSKIRCHQIRTIDKSRFIKPIGSIPQMYWESIEKALRIHLNF